MSLIECVPNFSEGRNREIIDKIVGAISSVDGIYILDRESDENHNRSVVTFAGDSSAVLEAAFRGIKEASSNIDMFRHKGEHPRFGATDVVPFVPIDGTMDECIDMARKLGRRVADELGIPVYLYGRASQVEWRSNLENIRNQNFQFEQLREKIGEEKWRPDFGRAEIGSAGATIIGARDFLIAYNVNLRTQDREIARKIAGRIREKAGGLKNVKALGFYLEDKKLAQVSMNLTDYRSSPIYRAYETVKMEASRYGIATAESEIVGLIPMKAVLDSLSFYLQLEGIDGDQILEFRLSKMLRGRTIDGFISDLASSSPTPGGGSASALVGAIAAALSSMVAALTSDKKKYEAFKQEMIELMEKSAVHIRRMKELIAEDEKAFNRISATWKMPKGTEEEKKTREAALQEALVQAVSVPMTIAEEAASVIEMDAALAEHGNINAISDVLCSAEFALAAVRGASSNVRINAKMMTDKESRNAIIERINGTVERAEKMLEKIRNSVDAVL
ncbi:MAG: glutamate formimidoyltransferase [Candidatus Thermoplasmatota archaeon]|nr:glutamate formimidoyltransferase [Candidatus Thermoplasmatota archaeon]